MGVYNTVLLCNSAWFKKKKEKSCTFVDSLERVDETKNISLFVVSKMKTQTTVCFFVPKLFTPVVSVCTLPSLFTLPK